MAAISGPHATPIPTSTPSTSTRPAPPSDADTAAKRKAWFSYAGIAAGVAAFAAGGGAIIGPYLMPNAAMPRAAGAAAMLGVMVLGTAAVAFGNAYETEGGGRSRFTP